MHDNNNIQTFNKIDMPFSTTYCTIYIHRCYTNEINARTTMVSIIYFIQYEYNITLEIIKRGIPAISLYTIRTCITLEYIIQYLYVGQYSLVIVFGENMSIIIYIKVHSFNSKDLT